MAIEKSGWAFDLNFAAHSSGSLAAYQYFLVYSTGVATNSLPYVALCLNSTNGSGRAIGVMQNDPAAGQAAVVRVAGITKVATQATVSALDPICCSTAGTAETATTTGEFVIGMALSASATTSGEIIDALLWPSGTWFA